jgi:glycosyltransferase involved in cell wall biosynthesis
MLIVRILMITQFYPPVMGGIERHVRNLSSTLAARGHSVVVASLRVGDATDMEMDGAVRVVRVRASAQRMPGLFSGDRPHSPPFPDPEVTLALRRIVRAYKPQIVHAHNWMAHSYWPLKTSEGVPLVVTLHDCSLSCVQMRMMYHDDRLCSGPAAAKCLGCARHHYGALKGTVTFLAHRIGSRGLRSTTDRFLPVSSAVAEANHLQDGAAAWRVIPNFVPDDPMPSPPATDSRLERLPAEPFILQVGDLAVDKGVNVLLEAHAALRDAPPLVLIGRRLPESPRDLPQNVTVIEGWPHELVMEAWRRALFGTVASLCMDASPTVVLEAMAAAKAVVGTRIGGIVDQVLEGQTGLLVPPADVSALRQAMQQLCDVPGVRQRMGELGRLRVPLFQASRVVDRIEGVYEELCLRG